jgi:hypothetical protein
MSTDKPGIPPPSTPQEVDEFVANMKSARPFGWRLLERLRAALRMERPADTAEGERPEHPPAGRLPERDE